MKDTDFDGETRFVTDSSIIICFLLPDEQMNETHTRIFERFVQEDVTFSAPRLLKDEVANTLKMAVTRKRITREQAREACARFLSLPIVYADISYPDVLDIACSHPVSFYDAQYLWLSRELGIPLLTLDTRLNGLATRV